jgi:phosphate starvation-inducible protein PhoH and related proteins
VQELTQVKIIVPGDNEMVSLFGTRDELLKVIEKGFPSTTIVVRGNEITISGEPSETETVARLFEELIELMSRGHVLTTDSVGRSIDMVKLGDVRPSQVLTDAILTTRTRSIRAKTVGQKRYIDAIRRNTITFGIGPAGTGKTYLAVAAAVQALQSKQVQRIILTRPAVEAGEHLGFLPGDIAAKVDPYLRPLYDALYEMLEPDAYAKAMERGMIEVAPLAFMRGRTLNDSFIILDEAQNTTAEQMKMFLTRLGFGSRAVVTGDVTQIDLPRMQTSGLTLVQKILNELNDVEFCYLDANDVVRHKLVQEIVEAYRLFNESNLPAELELDQSAS